MNVERAINVLTAGVLCTVVALLVQRYTRSANDSGTAGREHRFSESLNIDFKIAPRTLIVVVQQDCRYCADSMPFYRRLVEKRNYQNTELQIVVAAPQRDKDISRYLASYAVTPDAVIHPKPGTLPVHVTPTLLLAGSAGELVKMWEGFLSAAQQQSVVASLFPTD